MLGCRGVQANLTAWVDGELSPWRRRWLAWHLARCGECATAANSMEAVVRVQRQALLQLVTPPVDIDTANLLREVRRQLAADPGADEGWFARRLAPGALRPLVITAATVMVLLGFVARIGGPKDILIPLGVKSPPPKVKQEPDLFRNYSIIEELDALENFDTVEAEPLDENGAAQRG